MTTLQAVETARGRRMDAITPEGASGIAAVAAAVGGLISRALTLRAEERKDERAVLLRALEGYREETVQLRQEMRTLEGHIRELYTMNAALVGEKAELEDRVQAAEMRADIAAREAQELRDELEKHGIHCPGHRGSE